MAAGCGRYQEPPPRTRSQLLPLPVRGVMGGRGKKHRGGGSAHAASAAAAATAAARSRAEAGAAAANEAAGSRAAPRPSPACKEPRVKQGSGARPRRGRRVRICLYDGSAGGRWGGKGLVCGERAWREHSSESVLAELPGLRRAVPFWGVPGRSCGCLPLRWSQSAPLGGCRPCLCWRGAFPICAQSRVSLGCVLFLRGVTFEVISPAGRAAPRLGCGNGPELVPRSTASFFWHTVSVRRGSGAW